MAYIYYLDRAKSTTTTTGTGAYAIGAAQVGYQSVDNIVDDLLIYYTVTNGVDWETGIGTKTAGTVARTTILESSNVNMLVNWPAGNKDLFVTPPSDYFQNAPTRVAIHNLNFGSFTDRVSSVINGQFWVSNNLAVSAQILPENIDEALLLDMRVYVTDIIEGVGYTLTLYTQAEAKQSYRVMVIGG